jgi:hypothetical protein
MNENPSLEIAEAMEVYLSILIRHGNNDLDVMTNAIIHVKEHLSQEKYNFYKTYILQIGGEG